MKKTRRSISHNDTPDWDIEGLEPEFWRPSVHDRKMVLTLFPSAARLDSSYLVLHSTLDPAVSRSGDFSTVYWVGPLFPSELGTVNLLATYASIVEAHPYLKEVLFCRSVEPSKLSAMYAVDLLVTPTSLET